MPVQVQHITALYILVDIVYTSREVHEARCGLLLAAGRVRSKEKKRTTTTTKIRRTQTTPRNPQPPGDRDQLETERGETRPTR